MPLCHWPCSCYPNHALGQVDDWMNEIYQRWVAAHGVVIVTPVYWYQAPSVLKLMIDRLVCADGGNPDPDVDARQEAGGGEGARAGGLGLSEAPRRPRLRRGRARRRRRHRRRAPRAVATGSTGWGSSTPGRRRALDRYIGYYEPYATSHDALDRDKAVQEEVRNRRARAGARGAGVARRRARGRALHAAEAAAEVNAARRRRGPRCASARRGRRDRRAPSPRR